MACANMRISVEECHLQHSGTSRPRLLLAVTAAWGCGHLVDGPLTSPGISRPIS